MFGALNGTPPRKIALETHDGQPIKNEIHLTPTVEAKSQHEQYRKQFGKNWIPRKAPCGVYNCFGMVFASRRTGIFDDAEIDKILKGDGYERIDDPQFAKIGDIVIYRLWPSNVLMHAGLVVSVLLQQPIPTIYVLSKWNLGWGEDIHPIGEITCEAESRSWELWSDRKNADNKRTARALVLT